MGHGQLPMRRGPRWSCDRVAVGLAWTRRDTRLDGAGAMDRGAKPLIDPMDGAWLQ